MTPDIEHEAWLARRLKLHGFHDGLTTTESRREQLREAIQRIGPQVIVGKHPKTGKAESYAAVYERLFGMPFEIREDFL